MEQTPEKILEAEYNEWRNSDSGNDKLFWLDVIPKSHQIFFSWANEMEFSLTYPNGEEGVYFMDVSEAPFASQLNEYFLQKPAILTIYKVHRSQGEIGIQRYFETNLKTLFAKISELLYGNKSFSR
jgi:hypothetical protein